MEVLPVLRALGRGRWLIAAGALAAICLAVMVGRPTSTSSGFARTRVVLDTPRSQLIASAPAGAESLPWRAALMMHLMSADSSRQLLAQRLGVPLEQVAVVDTVLAVPQVVASMPQIAAKAAAVTVAPYVLTLSLPSETLPIISIDAAAPDREGAGRLAQAAVAVFEAQSTQADPYTSLIHTDAADAPRLQPFVVEQVAPVHVKRLSALQLPIKRLGAIFFLFAAWCVCVVALPRIGRRRKIAAVRIVQ